MKITGLFLLAIGIISTGFKFAESVKMRIVYDKKIVKMLNEIRTLMTFREYSLKEIFGKIKIDLTFLEFENFNAPFNEIWEKNVENDENLQKQEKELLLQFGNELGTTDTENQIAIINLYLERFNELLAELSEAAPRKSKVYRTIGIFFASIVFIIGI